jgi:hypothetical protein
MIVAMIEESWHNRVDRFVAAYKRGEYTALELQFAVVAAMPVESVGELLSRLPDQIIRLLRVRANEYSNLSEDDWASLISIKGPPPTEESSRLSIRKWLALNAYFLSHVDDS